MVFQYLSITQGVRRQTGIPECVQQQSAVDIRIKHFTDAGFFSSSDFIVVVVVVVV